MPFYSLIVIGCISWAVISLGVLPSPFSRTLVRVRNGEIRIERGDLNARAKQHVADVIREFRVEKGFITISQGRGVTFSLGIPEASRQTLRNILLN
jgi:hypothetical protein